MDTEETRAEIARRRLAQLVASFEDHVPAAAADDSESETGSHRLGDALDPVPGPGPVPIRRRVTQLHVRVVVALVAAVAVVVAWSVLSGRPQAEPAGSGEPGSALTEGSAAPASPDGDGAAGAPVTEGEIVVDVAGMVQRPGIVTLPAGSRVHEAIEKAGGLAGAVDTTGLNLARRLVDGEQVLVGIAPVAPAGGGGAADGPVNLNSATVDELDELPGVGPVTAQSIVDWRTENGSFTSVDDLMEVQGIGEGTLSDLRDLVAV